MTKKAPDGTTPILIAQLLDDSKTLQHLFKKVESSEDMFYDLKENQCDTNHEFDRYMSISRGLVSSLVKMSKRFPQFNEDINNVSLKWQNSKFIGYEESKKEFLNKFCPFRSPSTIKLDFKHVPHCVPDCKQ